MAPTDEPGQTAQHASPFGTTPPGPPPADDAGRGGRMPRWLPRAVALVLALYAAFQLGTWAFHQLTGLLINILIAFFLALAIEPAVSWMASRGLRRGLATGLVFLAVMIMAAGFVILLGSMLAGQIIKIVEDFPNYLDSVIHWINTHFHTDLKRVDVQEGLLRSDWLRNYVQHSATGVLDVSAQVLGGLFQLLTITLFSFYFAADGPRLRRAICSVLPPARQAEVLRAWEIAVNKTGGYIYSRGLMALISGVAHYILLQILGVPYAPVLGVWVGLVSQFIPTIGTYLAGALPMLIAFTVDPWYALWVLIFVVVYQQFENYMLQPKLTAKTVDIHPAVAFGSVIAGTALLGAVGALIAIPAVATLQAFLGAYVKRYAVTDDPRVHGHRRGGSGRGLFTRAGQLWARRPGADETEQGGQTEPPESGEGSSRGTTDS
ncbi:MULTISPECIES: AI-2E family transporter [unclassified Streptomyces]|uniref:AI-2E family transporter n=1 Tax=unclassified Streptomyces TaxID=2593676 RepID=UPI002251825A|nr:MULTISPECIES: AI-2E family transporter [unclassified Streptomyces]MCX5061809.1 AI-2E family transporter [Streptomyces sp. NBC_00452]MCX5249364.1 AI-2E family transporter [Streptomyces sp. NBC_00201]